MKWYVFLVAFVILYSVSATQCYQEYFNYTSPLDTNFCNIQRGSGITPLYTTILWTNYKNGIDGDWNTFANTTNAATTTMVLYYLKPFNTTLNSSIWEVKWGNGTDVRITNYTINGSCLDYNPVQLRINAAYSSRRTSFECWNGVTFTALGSDTAKSTALYEEAVIWNVTEGYPEYWLMNAGNHTLSIPIDVYNFTVEGVGAGGSGATPSAASTYRASGGGGGGAYSRRFVNVTPLFNYSAFVGGDSFNLTGNDTYFVNVSYFLAKGGKVGIDSNSTTPSGGAGGLASESVGDYKLTGGYGGYGYVVTGTLAQGGGGGSGAGNITNGNNATSDGGAPLRIGGKPANYWGGLGGNGSMYSGFCLNGSDNGRNYGGGGGGSSKTTGSCNGGYGGNGYIRITFQSTVPADTCTYSGSGNWDILCSDSCTLSTNTFIFGNITFKGTGTVNIKSNLTMIGTNKFWFLYPTCQLNTYKGGGIGG